MVATAEAVRYGRGMKTWIVIFLGWLAWSLPVGADAAAEPKAKAELKVVVLPIREDIMPPLVYVVRRGVKLAIKEKADVLVLDMDTNGGDVGVTVEIVGILGQFKGETITYVNRKGFSAGAFIAVATQKIYMAPQSVIGAAAPLKMASDGSGVAKLAETEEAKITSAIRALVRTSAEKNGHNIAVIEAMIDRTKELTVDGEVLNEKGQILTLTNKQAEKSYGKPGKPLLSLGTVESLDELLKWSGLSAAKRFDIKPTGVERLATWINTISPLLLMIGIAGIYIEMKTPGFGLPGFVGASAFAIYFLGGYVAGLSGMEWIAVFVIGLLLVMVEFFVFPGSIVLGLLGAGVMLAALVMAMVDIYPGAPALPTLPQIRVPLARIMFSFLGAGAVCWVLSLWLPKTSLYGRLVTKSVSGERTVVLMAQEHARRVGQVGVSVSPLRPGGKGRFGDDVIDVISQGEMIAPGQGIRVIGHSAHEAIVEPV